jgi:uncharacterized membrane protein YdfJ with MMPL/SSD domain
VIRTSALSSITALAALAMPKCPLCVIGLLPALVAIAVTRSSWWQPAAALAGAGCAIAGRFVVDVPLLFHAGVLVIVAASLLRKREVCR